MYSLAPILHHVKDKQGKQKVQVLIIYKRAKVYLPTNFKVFADRENSKINAIVRKQMQEAEDILLDAIREGLTVGEFKTLFKKEKAKSILLSDYIATLTERLKGRMSENTLRHYTSLGNKLPGVYLSEIDKSYLDSFERSLSHLDPNTVFANLKRLKSILYKAERDELIKKEQFERYKVPKYTQKLVEYLTEKEMGSFTKVVRAIQAHNKKLSGWYFLLSCYTGWRISDAKRFNPAMIEGDVIKLRAKKNGEVVSFPLISRLKEVLKFVTKHPFDISEKVVRKYVMEIAKDAGITKRCHYHVSRHSFGNLLAAYGFSIKEIAEKMGDSELIARQYVRIHNVPLNNKLRERLG